MNEKDIAPIKDEEITEILRLEKSYYDMKSEGYSDRRISSELSIPRSTLKNRVEKMLRLRAKYPKDTRLDNSMILPGSVEPQSPESRKLPKKGMIHRYILTSAQNNTQVHKKFFENLIAYSDWLDAELLVGTFTYSHNNNSEFTVKRGTNKEQKSLWWDIMLDDYISDDRIQLAPNLVWCGDWNISPTTIDPVASLDSFNGVTSNIFPNAKIRQKSIPVQKGIRVKRNMTTGTVTKLNYVQRKAGMRAEFDHVFGAIIVEVDSDGVWLHRQLMADSMSGDFYDLDIKVSNGEVKATIPNVAIVHGDLHAAKFDQSLFELIFDKRNPYSVASVMAPVYDVLHDVLDFESQNYHDRDIFSRYKKSVLDRDDVEKELEYTSRLLDSIASNAHNIIIPYSNHDDMLKRWLQDMTVDFRRDTTNAICYLKLMLRSLEAIRDGDDDFSIWEYAVSQHLSDDNLDKVKFLTNVDSTYTIEGIEVGKHGHVGKSGSRGTLTQYASSGVKTVVGHYHKAEIDRGAFSVGVYSKLWPEYAKGYSSWTHTFCVIYPNGKRTLVDIVKDNNGDWVWKF